MTPAEGRATGPLRGFAVVAVALAGLALAFTSCTERLDNRLLDAQWSLLRKLESPRPAPADIVIVGVDERTEKSIAAPRGLWHEAVGMTLARIASARPRAIGIELPLPERSYEEVRPGVDRALLVGLAAARGNGPLVATLSIDARTRTARPIHAPFLALLGEEGLGLGLLARDIDGVARRFTLAVPTEDGAFPTLAGRICRALSKGCVEGLLHFALGEPYRYIPLRRVLETRDPETLASMFRDRIVLLGEVHPYGGRIAVPANLAGWEEAAGDTPSIVVHAQTLRTALNGAAPREVSRVPVVLLVTGAAFLVLLRDWRHALLMGAAAGAALFVLAAFVLRGGIHVPIAAPLFTLLLAAAGRTAWSFRQAFELRRRA